MGRNGRLPSPWAAAELRSRPAAQVSAAARPRLFALHPAFANADLLTAPSQ